MQSDNSTIPNPSQFTSAALRHSLRVELNAPLFDVWALVGNHSRLPEFSAGIARVELDEDRSGSRARVCHFRAPDGSDTGPALREKILWETPNLGYATSAEPGNAFGLDNSFS